MNSYFTLDKASNGEFFFNLKAGNHETVLTSQLYDARDGVINGIKSVQENSQKLSRFENRESDAKQPHYFVLKAKNGQIIGKSENYPNTQNRDVGIRSVHENGCTIRIKDLINDQEIICLELVVNGDPETEWDKATISYEELVLLAFGTNQQAESRSYTVKYSDGPSSNPSGLLVKGDKINVKPKMICNVSATDKS